MTLILRELRASTEPGALQEAYVLTPRVMARAVAMPGALVIVAALGGAALGGILGALVAVPIAAAGITIVNRVIIPHQQAGVPRVVRLRRREDSAS
ncbi:AI-2E family transporter [Microbacterium sp.]|uniref:AI-2E family transporter n=1 Tax=Microbacterium sp. TaxID=51671 RepID=UPI0037359DB8